MDKVYNEKTSDQHCPEKTVLLTVSFISLLNLPRGIIEQKLRSAENKLLPGTGNAMFSVCEIKLCFFIREKG